MPRLTIDRSLIGSRRRFPLSVLAAVGAAVVLAVIGAIGPGAASANSFSGLLAGGTISSSGYANNQQGGHLYFNDQWSAAPNAAFNGFAYTAAGFGSVSYNAVGGISVGFGGDGNANQPSLLFPWTSDCAISNNGHYWANSLGGGGSRLAGEDGTADCFTNGDSGGWNYLNSEADNTSPGTNPQTSYSTLYLTAYCQAGTCQGTDAYYGLSVTNLSGNFTDPWNTPSGSLSWASSVNSNAWYQTNSGGLTLNASASDPVGVCSLSTTLSGPQTLSSGAQGNQNPGVTNVGGVIGTEFEFGSDPCWNGQTDTGSWRLPGAIASGTYSPTLQASNPGDYEAQGFSANGSPTVTATNSINIDDQTPQMSWSNPPSTWTSQSAETLDVYVGPSGISSLTCTDDGAAITPSLVSGSTSGGGWSAWTVPTTGTSGNNVSCEVANGDTNGALTASIGTTFDVDAVAPTVSFQDASYTPGAWTNSTQTVTVIPHVGPSGLHQLTCTLDGNPVTLAAGDRVTISGNSPSVSQPHVLSCYAESQTNESDESDPGTYDVAIDTNTPTLTFGGAAANGTWLSGTPTIVVTGGEENTATNQPQVMSGISSIVCTDNGSPISMPPLTAGYATSFQLTSSGANVISCVPTTVAGTVDKAFTETIDLEDVTADCSGSGCGTTTYGSSPQIDAGASPYSDGPSETTWARTAEPITITANAAGGQAPIASIACTGALSGTWPINNLNTDQTGGEQITISVPPPGGQLTCTAVDRAGNVYQLGSYQFEEDDTAPVGQFDQLSSGTPDDIQLTVQDPGGSLASGVAYVHVYATNTGTGVVYDLGLAHLVSGSSNVYDVNLDDADAPAGAYKFDAEVGDIAGNTADLTAGPAGGSTVWELPLRDNTSLSMLADGVSGTTDTVIPASLQPDVPNTSTTIPGAASTLQPVTVQGQIRGHWAGLLARQDRARATAMLADVSHARNCGTRGRKTACTKNTTTKTATKSTKAAGSAAVVTVGYGQKLTIDGALLEPKDGDSPIPNATIDIWGQVAGTSTPTLLGTTTTNDAGGYKYTISAGATRDVYATYAGTNILRGAVTQIKERFTGQVKFQATAAQAGRPLTLKGRVMGGHIPSGGLNITVEGRIVGYPGSQLLGTIHTNAKGVYRYSILMPKATTGLTYQLWLRVSPALNPAWPYHGARSKILTRRVR